MLFIIHKLINSGVMEAVQSGKHMARLKIEAASERNGLDETNV